MKRVKSYCWPSVAMAWAVWSVTSRNCLSWRFRGFGIGET